MARKNISLDLDAYETLRSLRLSASESFSCVVKRMGRDLAANASHGELMVARLFGPDSERFLPSEAGLRRLDRIQLHPRPRIDRRARG